MHSLRPFRGEIRFSSASHSATVTREGTAWGMADARELSRRDLIPLLLDALAISASIETVVSFKGCRGLVGRIRDGGGPRASWVVDYEAPNEQWGAIEDTIPSSLATLFEQLESEDPPNSDYGATP